MCTPKKTFTVYKTKKVKLWEDSLISYIIKAETEALDLTIKFTQNIFIQIRVSESDCYLVHIKYKGEKHKRINICQ